MWLWPLGNRPLKLQSSTASSTARVASYWSHGFISIGLEGSSIRQRAEGLSPSSAYSYILLTNRILWGRDRFLVFDCKLHAALALLCSETDGVEVSRPVTFAPPVSDDCLLHNCCCERESSSSCNDIRRAFFQCVTMVLRMPPALSSQISICTPDCRSEALCTKGAQLPLAACTLPAVNSWHGSGVLGRNVTKFCLKPVPL